LSGPVCVSCLVLSVSLVWSCLCLLSGPVCVSCLVLSVSLVFLSFVGGQIVICFLGDLLLG